MRRELRIHILEGTEAGGGSRIYACKRTARASAAVHHVGRADIVAGRRFSEVTCNDCRRAYRLVAYKALDAQRDVSE